MLVLAALGLVPASPAGAGDTVGPSSASPGVGESWPVLTPDARRLAAWVTGAGDNGAAPFLIIDKRAAAVFAFDREGGLVAGAPALLGLARGDVSPPDIGSRPLSRIGPADRITPAGRFVASQGVNLQGKSVLWIDYDEALSLHPVVTATPADRRRERLASATASDNRISYGCVNVAPGFYAGVVGPLFATGVGVVYILPEVRSIEEVFAVRASAPADQRQPPMAGR
jgi:hypothetical protein